MTEIGLNIEEEQESAYTLGGRSFRIRFYPFRELMYLDIYEGDNDIALGQRAMSNQWILPSYIGAETGNLRFETYISDADDYVWWEGFNTKFRLTAYSAEEIADMGEKGED